MAEGDETPHPDRHAFFVEIEDGGVRLSVECPYDRSDETRPCWPYDEDHIREEAPQNECTYEGWVYNLMSDEIMHGLVRLPLPTARAVWGDEGLEVWCV